MAGGRGGRAGQQCKRCTVKHTVLQLHCPPSALLPLPVLDAPRVPPLNPASIGVHGSIDGIAGVPGV